MLIVSNERSNEAGSADIPVRIERAARKSLHDQLSNITRPIQALEAERRWRSRQSLYGRAGRRDARGWLQTQTELL